MTYFTNIETIEELKKQYRKLAKQYHPDLTNGTTTEEMKQINAEYEELFDQVKNTFKNSKGETYQKANKETAGEFIEIINQLLKMQGLTVELIGNWLWVSGNTKEYKDQLKALGFKWCKNKVAWCFHREEWKGRSSKGSLDDIRNKYGSTKFKASKESEITSA